MATRKPKPNAIQKYARKQVRDAINASRTGETPPPQPIIINLTIPVKIDLNFFF